MLGVRESLQLWKAQHVSVSLHNEVNTWRNSWNEKCEIWNVNSVFTQCPHTHTHLTSYKDHSLSIHQNHKLQLPLSGWSSMSAQIPEEVLVLAQGPALPQVSAAFMNIVDDKIIPFLWCFLRFSAEVSDVLGLVCILYMYVFIRHRSTWGSAGFVRAASCSSYRNFYLKGLC